MTLDIQSQVVDDLNFLESRGALAGVAEVIRERRRQIEQLGYGLEHDETHDDGSLADRAAGRMSLVRDSRAEGTADPASDEGLLREAGALAAAEIDRLSRLMEPGDPRA